MATARSCGVLFAVISAMALLDLINTDLIDFIKPNQAAVLSFNPNGTEDFSIKRHCHVFKRGGWKSSVVENRPQLKS